MSVYPKPVVEKILFTTTNIVLAATHVDGDVLGGRLSANFAQRGSWGGILDSIRVNDIAAVGNTIDVYVFDDAPTVFADDAVFAPVDADLRHLIYKTSIAAWTAMGANVSYAEDINIDVAFDLRNGLYFYIVLNDATPSAYGAGGLEMAVRFRRTG